MSMRDLTEVEKALVQEEGITYPEGWSVIYSNGAELHLRNKATGTIMIMYWRN